MVCVVALFYPTNPSVMAPAVIVSEKNWLINASINGIISKVNVEPNSNVKKDEVDKFLRDVTNKDCHGIFLSQTSGVVGKDNYQIDIHNKNILI